MIVSKAVLVSRFTGQTFTFEKVAVKRDEGFRGGYWIYGDNNETVYMPDESYFYLENPTDATLKQFERRPQGDNDERK